MGGKAQSIYFHFDGHTEELGTFLQCGSSYNLCPGALESELRQGSTWTVPRLPLPPQETQTLAPEAAQSPPAWCSFHAWEASSWEATPSQLSDSTCFSQSRCSSLSHHSEECTPHTTICHCQPGKQLHSVQPEINRHQHRMWEWQGDTLSVMHRYPPRAQLWLSLWAQMQPGAWWEKHINLGP